MGPQWVVHGPPSKAGDRVEGGGVNLASHTGKLRLLLLLLLL